MTHPGARHGAPAGVRWRFSRRSGGVSSGRYASLNLADHVGDDAVAVGRNRAILADQLALPQDRVAIMQAAHGRDVAVVAEAGVVPGVDGLVTATPGLGLLALAADCATVALADPGAGVIGAVHSGWRGVAANAVGAVVDRMVEQGADRQRISAAIGPVICPGCYEVSEQVRDEVGAAAVEARAETRHGTPAVALQAGIAQQLRAHGITDMDVDHECTFESQTLFSYRRDGVTGRHGMLIVLDGEG